MSSVWPKTQKRIEHIGLELALNNPDLLTMDPTSSLPTFNDLSLPELRTSTQQQFNNNETIREKINKGLPKNQFFVNPNDEPIITNSPVCEIFELIDDLGYGSSGNVVKMRHIPTGTICAVKQMRTCDDERDKLVKMDLQVILTCRFEHIVRCHGYFIEGPNVWICMESMTTCFDKLLRAHKKPFPEKFLGAIACAAVKALNYLKETHKIMHRDIKPSNILINEEDGKIKLCDFGVSGKLRDSLANTRPAGCWTYFAPERLNPESRSYDIRADVWSLGITLYELATAKNHLSNCRTDIAFEVMNAVLHRPPPRLPDDMDFSDEFRDFISLCLTKDYTQRPKFKDLLDHKFIKMHSNTVVNLSDYVDHRS